MTTPSLDALLKTLDDLGARQVAVFGETRNVQMPLTVAQALVRVAMAAENWALWDHDDGANKFLLDALSALTAALKGSNHG